MTEDVSKTSPNKFSELVTFGEGITGTGNEGALTAGTGILATANSFTALQTFNGGITGSGNLGAFTAGTGITPENVIEAEVTGTVAQTIASFTPTASGNFIVFVYFRVTTAATTVTLAISWADVTGAQSNTVVSAVSEPVGSYTIAPLYINATTAAAIAVSCTAGTANQVYVSGTIMNVG